MKFLKRKKNIIDDIKIEIVLVKLSQITLDIRIHKLKSNNYKKVIKEKKNR